eukprot:6518014-Prymnesium_polylepis.1
MRALRRVVGGCERTDHVEHEDEATPRHHHVDVADAAQRAEDVRAHRRVAAVVGLGRAERTRPAVEGRTHR